MLVLLYYLAQNPDFPESVKPLMGQLKNSEQMLGFLNELSRFTQVFSTFKSDDGPKEKPPEPPKGKDCKKEEPQSPTQGIADEFIQQMLEGYLKKR